MCRVLVSSSYNVEKRFVFVISLLGFFSMTCTLVLVGSREVAIVIAIATFCHYLFSTTPESACTVPNLTKFLARIVKHSSLFRKH